MQGTSDFGAMPNFFPGYERVDDPDVRKRYERAWGMQLPAVPGFDNHQMVDAIHAGALKAMYIVGEDMGIVDSNANYVQEALSKLEFLVVQELFLTRTAQFADVVLPASPSLEKEGTFTNTERRMQRLYRALEPLGQSRPDWEILQCVANRLGANWSYGHPAEIMHEAASLAPLFAGVRYERLEGFSSLQWPVHEDGTDSPLLYTERFAFPDGRARLYPLQYIPPLATDEEYNLHLNNGRLLEHFHEGNMTCRTEGIRRKTPGAFLEISPELARERGVQDGTLVRLTSAHGSVKVRALVTDRVRGAELYLPMNSSGLDAVNYLTGSESDRATHTPAYKELAVRMEVLGDVGDRPLPRNNPRFGRPTPQRGVLVEDKWRRPDYRPLTEDAREGT